MAGNIVGVDWGWRDLGPWEKQVTTLLLEAGKAVLNAGSGDHHNSSFKLGEDGLPIITLTRHSSLMVWAKLDPYGETSFRMYIGVEDGEYVLKACRDWGGLDERERLEIRYGC